MTHYRTTVPSSLDREALCAYMADFSHAERWDPSVAKAEQSSDGPIGLGARFSLVVGFLGRRLSLEYAVTQFQPPSLVQVSASNAAFFSIDTMTFDTRDGGSVLAYDAELRLRGAYRLFGPLLNLGFRRVGDRAREGLVRELNP